MTPKARRPALSDPVALEALRRELSEKQSRLQWIPGPRFTTAIPSPDEVQDAYDEVHALQLQLDDSAALRDRLRDEREAKLLEANQLMASAAARAAWWTMVAAIATAIAALAALTTVWAGR